MNLDRFGKVLAVFTIIFAAMGVWYIYNTIAYAPLNLDGGYTLSVARIFANGGKLFKDINVFYTPMGMWIFSLFYPIFHENYPGYMVIAMLFLILSGIVLYRILREFSVRNSIAIFFTVYFIVMTIRFDGSLVFLEPFSAFWMLLSILTVIVSEKGNKLYPYFFSGIFLFFSYWSKQYGLMIIPGIVYFMLSGNGENKIKKLKVIIFTCGFITCVLVMLIYFKFNNINLLQVFGLMKGEHSSLIFNPGKITGFNYSIKGLIKILIKYSLKCVPVFFIALYYMIAKKIKFRRDIWFTFILLIGSFLPLYFAYYGHYFIYITPFIIMLVSILINKIFMSKRIIICFLAMLTIALTFLIRDNIRFKNSNCNRKLYQQEVVKLINNKVVTNSRVLFVGNNALSFIGNYLPVSNEIGYSLITDLKNSKLHENISSGSYIIYDRKYKLNFGRYNSLYSEELLGNPSPEHRAIFNIYIRK